MRVCVSAEALEDCNPVRIDAAVLTSGPTDACHGSKQTDCLWSRADRLDAGLFARCAGVHVDFHAHRDFDNLRSFPGHSFLPSILGAMWRRSEG
jgi:hypothetical protein